MKKISSPYTTFRFVSYAFDHATGEALLTYAFDDAMTFTERVTFPMPSQPLNHSTTQLLDRALFALHLVAGVSYYKAYLPPTIAVESGELTKDQAAFWTKLYTLGLGEFFYRNDLDFAEYIHFPSSAIHLSISPSLHLSGTLVPLGGGKDSLVTVELLRNAGVPFELVAMGRHDRLDAVAAAVGQPLAVIDRQLDPQLFALNKQGAYNGHVPISAYFAFVTTVYALLHGKRDIALSNERSANVGNVMVNGVDINHQYSKSLEFERDVQTYITSSITPDVRYFSALRPLSELAITKRFVDNGKYVDVFSSCNKNFAITKHAAQRWCGVCPKCAFVFALLAAFLPKDDVVRIFGKNLFDDTSLLSTYKELLAVEGIKPFECVGEPVEVKAAFVLAKRRGDFAGSVVMDWFAENMDDDVDIDAVLAPSKNHAMPKEYADLLAQE